MRRIAIFGSPGSGKTELAEELGIRLSINEQFVYHLDNYFWKKSWEKTSLEERLAILHELLNKKEWIVEGNFSNTVDFQLQFAEQIINLQISKYTCLFRILKKWISYIGNGIPDFVPGLLKDRITMDYIKKIWIYPSTEGKELSRKINVIERKIKIVTIKNSKELAIFLENPFE